MGKYFKYAVGEILLVVIGILIALQINNWNEKKSEKDKLNEYLVAFKEEVKGNIGRLERAEDRSDVAIQRTKNLIRVMNSDSAKYLSSKDLYARSNFVGPVTKIELFSSVYKDLINSGTLKTLEESSLKRRIFQMEREFENYDEIVVSAKKIWDDFLLPYYHEHQNVLGVWNNARKEEAIPITAFNNDMDAFVNNRKYTNILTSRIFQLTNIKVIANYMKVDYDKLIEDIDTYLADE
ncbi:MAG: DUF6090 family protein [Bacteroidota bacterium]